MLVLAQSSDYYKRDSRLRGNPVANNKRENNISFNKRSFERWEVCFTKGSLRSWRYCKRAPNKVLAAKPRGEWGRETSLLASGGGEPPKLRAHLA